MKIKELPNKYYGYHIHIHIPEVREYLGVGNYPPVDEYGDMEVQVIDEKSEEIDVYVDSHFNKEWLNKTLDIYWEIKEQCN